MDRLAESAELCLGYVTHSSHFIVVWPRGISCTTIQLTYFIYLRLCSEQISLVMLSMQYPTPISERPMDDVDQQQSNPISPNDDSSPTDDIEQKLVSSISSHHLRSLTRLCPRNGFLGLSSTIKSRKT